MAQDYKGYQFPAPRLLASSSFVSPPNTPRRNEKKE